MSDDASTDVAPTADEAESGRGHWIEIAAAALLGIAAVLTAYAAYNGALAGGDALKGYTQSSRTTADANGYYNDYSQTYSADQALFLQYRLLVLKGDQESADEIKDTMFSDELTAATDAWLQQPNDDNAMATPLGMKEYVVQAFIDAEQLTDQANQEFADAQKIDDQGDNFDLAAVYLAVSLFFAGMAALFRVRRLQLVMLGLGGVLLLPGLYAIAQGKGWM